MKTMKRCTLPVLFLSLLLLLSMIVPVSAQTTGEESFSLTLMNQNVAGLPIPAVFNDNNKVVGSAQIALGKLLNECGCDIVCVQEDFQYHDLLAAQMTNYPYYTLTSGGIPMGDGLNVFSKYPIYNVVRVAWTEANGILDDDCDELTPKGFLKVTVLVNNTYIDVYDVHFDAGSSEDDLAAKKAQLQQITAFINENSADKPVVITGDFNMTLHTHEKAGFYPILIQENGFTDAWAHCVNNDNYLHGDDRDTLINYYNTLYAGCSNHGYWDSLERACTRSSSSVTVVPTEFSYVTNSDDATNIYALTDHRASYTRLQFTVKATQTEETLETQKKTSLLTRTKTFVSCTKRSLKLILSDLFN